MKVHFRWDLITDYNKYYVLTFQFFVIWLTTENYIDLQECYFTLWRISNLKLRALQSWIPASVIHFFLAVRLFCFFHCFSRKTWRADRVVLDLFPGISCSPIFYIVPSQTLLLPLQVSAFYSPTFLSSLLLLSDVFTLSHIFICVCFL